MDVGAGGWRLVSRWEMRGWAFAVVLYGQSAAAVQGGGCGGVGFEGTGADGDGCPDLFWGKISCSPVNTLLSVRNVLAVL